ncbi:hypothetical protein [Agreia sp. COWG]|uniref:hypothetical protein n=1 Tax=Agreia sp. COWG TaxID=2773266 RepID=UPI001927F2BD|nr:hypothetical protein [Agreia sp. COWG]CAD6009068.1 conserved protein of unknown function [Agreia sp. COWG]
MNTSSLINQVNESLATLGAGPFMTSGSKDTDTGAVVTGKLDGRVLRIEFVEEGSGDTPEKGHRVDVIDDATGQNLGTGRGDSTFADAISSHGWAGTVDALKNLG